MNFLTVAECRREIIRLQGREIDLLETIEKMQAQINALTIKHETMRPPRVQAIVDQVCQEVGLTEMQVFSASRFAPLVEARQRIWWEIRQLSTPMGDPFSYPMIGKWFKKDHTTILHGVQEYEKRLAAKLLLAA